MESCVQARVKLTGFVVIFIIAPSCVYFLQGDVLFDEETAYWGNTIDLVFSTCNINGDILLGIIFVRFV